MEINKCLKAALKYLKLSNNSLNAINIERFFLQNFSLKNQGQGFINLKILKLSSNYLDDNFLTVMKKNQIKEIFLSLTTLDVSDNLITFNSAIDICDLVLGYKKLSYLNLKNNKIEEYIYVIVTQIQSENDLFLLDEEELIEFYHFFDLLIKVKKFKSFSLAFSKRIKENIECLIKEENMDSIFVFE